MLALTRPPRPTSASGWPRERADHRAPAVDRAARPWLPRFWTQSDLGTLVDCREAALAYLFRNRKPAAV